MNVKAFDAFTQTCPCSLYSEWFICNALEKSNVIYFYLPFLYCFPHAIRQLFSKRPIVLVRWRLYIQIRKLCLFVGWLLTLLRCLKSSIQYLNSHNNHLTNWFNHRFPNQIGFFCVCVLFVFLHRTTIVMWN